MIYFRAAIKGISILKSHIGCTLFVHQNSLFKKIYSKLQKVLWARKIIKKTHCFLISLVFLGKDVIWDKYLRKYVWAWYLKYLSQNKLQISK